VSNISSALPRCAGTPTLAASATRYLRRMAYIGNKRALIAYMRCCCVRLARICAPRLPARASFLLDDMIIARHRHAPGFFLRLSCSSGAFFTIKA